MLVRTGAVWRVKYSSASIYCTSGEGSICWVWPWDCTIVWRGGIVCPDNSIYLSRGLMVPNRNLFNLGIVQQCRFPWLGPIKNKSQDIDSKNVLASLQEAWQFEWSKLQQNYSSFLIILTLITPFASKNQVEKSVICVRKGCRAFLPWMIRRGKGAVCSYSNPFGLTVLDQLLLG